MDVELPNNFNSLFNPPPYVQHLDTDAFMSLDGDLTEEKLRGAAGANHSFPIDPRKLYLRFKEQDIRKFKVALGLEAATNGSPRLDRLQLGTNGRDGSFGVDASIGEQATTSMTTREYLDLVGKRGQLSSSCVPSQLSHSGFFPDDHHSASGLEMRGSTSSEPDRPSTPVVPACPVTTAPQHAALSWLFDASSSAVNGHTSSQAERNSPPVAKANPPGKSPYPDLTPFRGEYDFYVEPPEDELLSGRTVSRSVHCTFDSSQRTFYMKPAKCCSLRVNLGYDLPPNAFLHTAFAFEEREHCFEPVVRCANHREIYAKTTLGRFDRHFGLSENQCAVHKIDSGNPIIIIPYGNKSQGVHIEVFQFSCFTSSCLPFKKKTLKMIMTLFRNGQVVGRDFLYLRVCACPGRDRISLCNKQQAAAEVERRKRTHLEANLLDDDEVYTIKRTIHGYRNYILIHRMMDNMESLNNGINPLVNSPGVNTSSPSSCSGSDT